jgi:hypothetical protein
MVDVRARGLVFAPLIAVLARRKICRLEDQGCSAKPIDPSDQNAVRAAQDDEADFPGIARNGIEAVIQ